MNENEKKTGVSNFKRILKMVGPGLIMAGACIGPASLTTAGKAWLHLWLRLAVDGYSDDSNPCTLCESLLYLRNCSRNADNRSHS